MHWGIVRKVADGSSSLYKRRCYGYRNNDEGYLDIDASFVLDDTMEKLVLSAIAALEGKPFAMTFFEEPALTPMRLKFADEGLLLFIGDYQKYLW